MARSASKAGYQEIRGQLGVFGWIWRIRLLLWQAAVIGWVVSYASTVAPAVEAGGAEGVGAAIGGMIGIGFIIAIWGGSTIILGLFVLLTRRTQAMVPIDRQTESAQEGTVAEIRGQNRKTPAATGVPVQTST